MTKKSRHNVFKNYRYELRLRRWGKLIKKVSFKYPDENEEFETLKLLPGEEMELLELRVNTDFPSGWEAVNCWHKYGPFGNGRLFSEPDQNEILSGYR